MKRSIAVLLSAIAMLIAADPSRAADDPSQIVNSPADLWGVWGPAKFDVNIDTDVPGGMIRRITIANKPAQPWDVGVWNKIIKPVKTGDVLLVTFWARAEKLPAGSDFIVINGRVVETAADAGVTPDTTVSIGKSWKKYYLWGKSAKDYDPVSIQVSLVVGSDAQTIDLGPVTVADYGPDYELTKLPQN